MAEARDTIITALLAFAGGFLGGILLAPESGEKTRARIALEGKTQLRRLEEKLDALQNQVSGLQDSVRGAGADVSRKVREAGSGVGEKVKEAAHHAVDQVVPTVPDDPKAFSIENSDLTKDLRRIPRK